jgi:pyruvate dehydrogenase E1 component
MDSMFPTAKIYSPHGQRYDSVDRKMLLKYIESTRGQMLHEGISEAGAMASTIAAGSSYATHGEPMIPVYIFYSMFGFQRTGDLIWAFADQLGRGFLLGATSGRTTLTGEGLQHADGHSPLLAASNPACVYYDPAFAYEISHIVQDGIRRMYGSTDEHPHGEDVFFYLSVYNEPIVQPVEPDDVDVDGILRGMHRVATAQTSSGDTSAAHTGSGETPAAHTGSGDRRPRVQLLASGVAVPWALKAQRLLADEWEVAADVWSVTSWNELNRQALAVDHWNMLHPDEEQRTPYITTKLADAPGPLIAVSDYMRAVVDQIAPWVESDWHSLGTDGFGFADTRAAARRFFQVDAESITVAALEALAQRGQVDKDAVLDAFERYRIDDPTAVRGVKQEGAEA